MAKIKGKTDDTGAVKVLRRNSDNVVVRAYSNTDTITLLSDKIKVIDSGGNGVENWSKSVGYNSSNMTVHSGVTLPDGSKAGGNKLAVTVTGSGGAEQAAQVVDFFSAAGGLSSANTQFNFNATVDEKFVYTGTKTFTLSTGSNLSDSNITLFQF